jgi:hypothetical protein
VEIRGSQSEVGPGKSERHYLKNKLKQKRLGHDSLGRGLPSKCETLRSNLSITKKKKIPPHGVLLEALSQVQLSNVK